MKEIVVLYHKDCPDGFGAAYAAWKKFGDKADYIAVQHQDDRPAGLVNKELYLVDFCYPLEKIQDLQKKNKRVTVIDHHVTAEQTVKKTQDYLYDVNHSGAVLTWKYFHPGKPVPRLLLHVEDVDLWKFKIPHTKEVIAFIGLCEYDFEEWDNLAEEVENTKKRAEIIMKGGTVLRYQTRAIDKLVKNNSALVRFEGFDCLCVNAANWTSEIGNKLVKAHPPVGIVWRMKDGKIIVSLRSDGVVDVAEIALRYNGGGHKAAAGFVWDVKKGFPWTFKKQGKK